MAHGRESTLAFVCRQVRRDLGIMLDPSELYAEMMRLTRSSPERYTCGDLADFLWGRLGDADEPAQVRPLRPIYYRVRNTLAAAWQVFPSQVKPSSELRRLADGRSMRMLWYRLRGPLWRDLPELEMSRRAWRITLAASVALATALLLLFGGLLLDPLREAAALFNHHWLAMIFIAVAVVGIAVLLVVLATIICCLPLEFVRSSSPFATVRQLVEHLAREDRRGGEVKLPWTRELTWYVLRCALREASPAGSGRLTRRTPLIGLFESKCRRCGYDLRASLDRCPECGMQI